MSDPNNPNASPSQGGGGSKRLIPGKYVELLSRARVVQKAWLGQKPRLELLWTDPSAFESTINAAGSTFVTRTKSSGDRVELTSLIKELDNEVDLGVRIIKSALTTKHKSVAKGRVYYLKFGIKAINGSYEMPIEQSARIAALNLAKDAVVSEGLSDMELGAAYWADLCKRYTDAIEKAGSLDGGVSLKVGDKTRQAREIRTTLNAIIHLIRANYPENADAMLRSWGFQKEKA